jgi:hypothetical protein
LKTIRNILLFVIMSLINGFAADSSTNHKANIKHYFQITAMNSAPAESNPWPDNRHINLDWQPSPDWEPADVLSPSDILRERQKICTPPESFKLDEIRGTATTVSYHISRTTASTTLNINILAGWDRTIKLLYVIYNDNIVFSGSPTDTPKDYTVDWDAWQSFFRTKVALPEIRMRTDRYVTVEDQAEYTLVGTVYLDKQKDNRSHVLKSGRNVRIIGENEFHFPPPEDIPFRLGTKDGLFVPVKPSAGDTNTFVIATDVVNSR